MNENILQELMYRTRKEQKLLIDALFKICPCMPRITNQTTTTLYSLFIPQ